MHFRHFLIALASALVAHPVVAQQAIDLQPDAWGETVSFQEVQNISGSCGQARVKLVGVLGYESGSYFRLDHEDGDIILRRGDTEQLSLASEWMLQDLNGVACVETENGPRLIVWGNCMGTGCGMPYTYSVIDPDALRVLAGGADDLCDLECATTLTGSQVPLEVEVMRMAEMAN